MAKIKKTMTDMLSKEKSVFKLVRVPFFDRSSRFKDGRYFNTYFYPPLGLGLIAAYLREKGIIVDLDDLNIKTNNLEKIRKFDFHPLYSLETVLNHLKGEKNKKITELIDAIISLTSWDNYDLIGLSAEHSFYESLYLPFLIAQGIKEKKRTIPIALGGGIMMKFMYYPELFEKNDLLRTVFLNKKIIDYLAIGPGEQTCEELLLAIKQNKRLSDVPGLIYFQGKAKVNLPKNKPKLIKPDFDGLPLNLYRRNLPEKFYPSQGKNKEGILVLPFRFINGCPYQCAFCPFSLDNGVDFIAPKQIVAYLKDLSIKYEVNCFIFLNNTINISKNFMREFTDELIKQNLEIQWMDCANFIGLDAELLKKAKKSGCRGLTLGVETVSLRLRENFNKSADLADVKRILRELHQLGIWVGIEVIVGLPGERNEDFKELISFLKDNIENINTLYCNKFRLYAESLMCQNPERYGLKNIRINRRKRFFFNNYNFLSFDEENGLSFSQRSKYSEKAIKKIKKIFPREKINSIDYIPDQFSYLFSLFSQGKNMQEAEDEFYKRLKRLTVDSDLYFYSEELLFLRNIFQAKAYKFFLKLKKIIFSFKHL